MKSVGQVIFAFFEDYLKTQKGLRPGSDSKLSGHT